MPSLFGQKAFKESSFAILLLVDGCLVSCKTAECPATVKSSLFYIKKSGIFRLVQSLIAIFKQVQKRLEKTTVQKLFLLAGAH